MSFVAECPFCSHRVQVPEKGYAASITCPKCKDGYTAVPVVGDASADEPMPEPLVKNVAVKEKPRPTESTVPKMGLPATAAAAKPESEPESEAPPAPSFTPVTLPDAPDDDDDESESTIPPLHGVSAVALLSAGFGIVSATIRSLCVLVLPLAIVALALGIVGVAILYKSQVSRLVSAVGAAIGGFLCLCALFLPSFLGPIYNGYAGAETVDPNIVQVVPFPGELHTDATYKSVGVDASKAALKKGNLWMRISRVSLEQEKPKTKAKNSPPGKTVLVIRLLVQRVGSGSDFADKTSWSQFTNQTKPQVQLFDSSGTNPYPQFRAAELHLKPKTKKTKPPPKETATAIFPISANEPTFYFAAPDANQPFLQLVVSLSAWGQDGEFRFQIPRGMIQSAKNLPFLNVP